MKNTLCTFCKVRKDCSRKKRKEKIQNNYGGLDNCFIPNSKIEYMYRKLVLNQRNEIRGFTRPRKITIRGKEIVYQKGMDLLPMFSKINHEAVLKLLDKNSLENTNRFLYYDIIAYILKYHKNPTMIYLIRYISEISAKQVMIRGSNNNETLKYKNKIYPLINKSPYTTETVERKEMLIESYRRDVTLYNGSIGYLLDFLSMRDEKVLEFVLKNATPIWLDNIYSNDEYDHTDIIGYLFYLSICVLNSHDALDSEETSKYTIDKYKLLIEDKWGTTSHVWYACWNNISRSIVYRYDDVDSNYYHIFKKCCYLIYQCFESSMPNILEHKDVPKSAILEFIGCEIYNIFIERDKSKKYTNSLYLKINEKLINRF